MKNYVRPMMESEVFAANEYIAACGEVNKVYKFECNAGNGNNGTVYLDSNSNGEWDPLGDEILTLAGYHACGKTHEAPTDDDFQNGFYITGIFPPYNVEKVIVWTENGTNVHCTNNLDMDSWETAKS